MQPVTDIETIHQGHDLETGLLSRARQWVDIFPWMRLGRILRVAGSPSLLAITAIAMALDSLGVHFLFGERTVPQSDQTGMVGLIFHSLYPIGIHLWSMMPISVFAWPFDASVVIMLSQIVWSLLVWIPVALLLTRQGDLIAADRPMMEITSAIRYALSRTGSAWIVAVVPLVCVLMIGVALMAIGLIASTMAGWVSIEIGWGLLAALIAIPAAILAIGSVPAIPMGWAALSNEGQPDPLDSLSRGYEYFYRRPLRWLLYIGIAMFLVVVANALATTVGWATASISSSMMVAAGGPPKTVAAAVMLSQQFPIVVSLTLFWSLMGGIYLLIRTDAGGQEVEDLWMPPTVDSPSLPTL